MPQDWFAQYAAKTAPAPPPQDDWFAQYGAKTPDAPPPAASALGTFNRQRAEGYGQLGQTVMDLGIGAAKGAGQTITSLGNIARKIPGVNALDRLMTPIPLNLEPQNTTQRVGKIGEQIAEVVAPGRALTSLGTKAAETLAPRLAGSVGRTAANLIPRAAVEGAGGAAMAAAQGGDPMTGGALGAAMPVAGRGLATIGEMVGPALRDAAQTQVVKALGPTKERFKAMAEKLAPEMLKRGIRGSRASLVEQAAAGVEAAGHEIETTLDAVGARQIGIQPVVEALERAKGAFQGLNPAGKLVVYEPRAVNQLSALQRIVNDMGPDARVDQVVAVRRAWDTVVAQAGGFAQRAPGAIGVPLKDVSEAASKRVATTAIRQLLNTEVPELTALNKEFSFWKSLEDVTTQTLKRTQPQGASLTGTVKEAGAQAAGAMVKGGTLGTAFALGKAANMANAVFTSPRWNLASAQMKDRLAEAIAANNLSGITTALARIGAVESSKPAMGWR